MTVRNAASHDYYCRFTATIQDNMELRRRCR